MACAGCVADVCCGWVCGGGHKVRFFYEYSVFIPLARSLAMADDPEGCRLPYHKA